MQLNSCTGAVNQQWAYDNTTGEIKVKGVQSGLCIDVGSTASCQEKPWSDYPYCNIQLDPLQRAQDLVGRMEVAEMVYCMYYSPTFIFQTHNSFNRCMTHSFFDNIDWIDGQ